MNLLVLCVIVGTNHSDTGIKLGFVNIKSATVFTEDFKCHIHFSNEKIEGITLNAPLAKSSRFERDKFMGYLFASFINVLTESQII